MSVTTEKPAEGRVFRLAVAPLRNVSVRDASATGDGSWTIEGYAAVFEQETVLYDGRFWRMREIISRGAFTNVLQRLAAGEELVHLNFGHDMNTAIAATNVTGIGGLELTQDDHGLRFFARVDSSDPDAIKLAVKLRRGVVAQASFAFTIASEHLDESIVANGVEDERWRITEIGHLYDVCACPQGAYPQTEVGIRTLTTASLQRSGLDANAIDELAQRAVAGGREQRADMEMVGSLAQMYEIGCSLMEDAQPDDPCVPILQGVMDGLEQLVEMAAQKPNAERSTGRPSGGHARRDPSGSGADDIAPPAGVTSSTPDARRLIAARAHAAATAVALTTTTGRNPK